MVLIKTNVKSRLSIQWIYVARLGKDVKFYCVVARFLRRHNLVCGTSGVGPLEMCNFKTISLPFVVYLLKIKFCEDSFAFFRWL